MCMCAIGCGLAKEGIRVCVCVGEYGCRYLCECVWICMRLCVYECFVVAGRKSQRKRRNGGIEFGNAFG